MSSSEPRDEAAVGVKPVVAGALVPVEFGERGVQLHSLDQAVRFAKWVHQSQLAPRGFDSEAKVLMAFQKGAEVGLTPLAALACIDVIEGVPCWKNAAALGLVRSSGKLAEFTRRWEGTPYEDAYRCVVFMKRADSGEAMQYDFSVEDANRAGLWNRKTRSGADTPWVTHPKRMLYFRALGFVLKDLFFDVLAGWSLADEVHEYAHATIDADRPSVPAPTRRSALLAGSRPAALPAPVDRSLVVPGPGQSQLELEPVGPTGPGIYTGAVEASSAAPEPTQEIQAAPTIEAEPERAAAPDAPPFDPEREPCPECGHAPNVLRAMGHGVIDGAECPLSGVMPDFTRKPIEAPAPASLPPVPETLRKAITKRMGLLGLVPTAVKAAQAQLELEVRQWLGEGRSAVDIAQKVLSWRPKG